MSEQAAPVQPGMRLPHLAQAAARILLGLMLVALVFLNVANALARATGTVVIGVDEVLVFGMIWMCMIGMLLVTVERGHIALEVFTARVGPRTGLVLAVIAHTVMLVGCGYAAAQSLAFVQRVTASGQTSMALGMPMLIPHSALLIGFGGTAMIAALLLVEDLRALITQRSARAEP